MQRGTFHENMGTIKDKNGKDLTEAEEIKKRWQESRRVRFPWWLKVKESANEGDTGVTDLIPGSGRFPWRSK